MTQTVIDRRGMLMLAAAIGAGSALRPADLAAQSKDPFRRFFERFKARDAGREHSRQLDRIRKDLNGKDSISPDGLANLIDSLVAMKVISEKEAAILKKLMSDIARASSIDALLNRIDQAIKEIGDTASELAQVIVQIARDSVDYARRTLELVDMGRVIYIVSSDVEGALLGAGTGFMLFGLPGAVVGGLIGAVSTSAKAGFGPK